jgi:hypothetical protein
MIVPASAGEIFDNLIKGNFEGYEGGYVDLVVWAVAILVIICCCIYFTIIGIYATAAAILISRIIAVASLNFDKANMAKLFAGETLEIWSEADVEKKDAKPFMSISKIDPATGVLDPTKTFSKLLNEKGDDNSKQFQDAINAGNIPAIVTSLVVDNKQRYIVKFSSINELNNMKGIGQDIISELCNIINGKTDASNLTKSIKRMIMAFLKGFFSLVEEFTGGFINFQDITKDIEDQLDKISVLDNNSPIIKIIMSALSTKIAFRAMNDLTKVKAVFDNITKFMDDIGVFRVKDFILGKIGEAGFKIADIIKIITDAIIKSNGTVINTLLGSVANVERGVENMKQGITGIFKLNPFTHNEKTTSVVAATAAGESIYDRSELIYGRSESIYGRSESIYGRSELAVANNNLPTEIFLSMFDIIESESIPPKIKRWILSHTFVNINEFVIL